MSGSLARAMGVLLVLLIIIGVLVAVFVAGVVTVVARALALDAEWVLAVVGAIVTLAIATGIVYAIYRVIPANPPSAASARPAAILVGIAIALMTLLYSIISPWLVSGFQAFGVMASLFAALVWLRFVFLAMIYGAALGRYRDFVEAANVLGEREPDAWATRYALDEEQARGRREMEGATEIDRRGAEAEDAQAVVTGDRSGQAD